MASYYTFVLISLLSSIISIVITVIQRLASQCVEKRKQSIRSALKVKLTEECQRVLYQNTNYFDPGVVLAIHHT